MAPKLPIRPEMPTTALEAALFLEADVILSAVDHNDFYAKRDAYLAGMQRHFSRQQIEGAYRRLHEDGL